VKKLSEVEYEITLENVFDCERLKTYNGKQFINSNVQVRVIQVEESPNVAEIFFLVDQKLRLRDRQDLLQSSKERNYFHGNRRARSLSAERSEKQPSSRKNSPARTRKDSETKPAPIPQKSQDPVVLGESSTNQPKPVSPRKNENTGQPNQQRAQNFGSGTSPSTPYGKGGGRSFNNAQRNQNWNAGWNSDWNWWPDTNYSWAGGYTRSNGKGYNSQPKGGKGKGKGSSWTTVKGNGGRNQSKGKGKG
jgi:hypothetical protein